MKLGYITETATFLYHGWKWEWREQVAHNKVFQFRHRVAERSGTRYSHSGKCAALTWSCISWHSPRALALALFPGAPFPVTRTANVDSCYYPDDVGLTNKSCSLQFVSVSSPNALACRHQSVDVLTRENISPATVFRRLAKDTHLHFVGNCLPKYDGSVIPISLIQSRRTVRSKGHHQANITAWLLVMVMC